MLICMKVLAPSFLTSVFFLPLRIQGLRTLLDVGQECVESIVADTFQVSEEAEVNVLAILQVDSAGGHLLGAQLCTQAHG